MKPEPLASLNHFTVPCSAMVLGVPFCVNRFYAGEIRRYCERLLAVEARTAHVRLGLTYSFILRRKRGICKGNATSAVGRTGAEVQGPRSAAALRYAAE